MKTKLHFTLVAIAGLIYGQNVNAQTTYDFNTDLTGVSTPAGSGSPAVGVIAGLTDNGVANNTKVLRQTTISGLTNQTCVNDLTLFSNDTDYSITWKEYVTSIAATLKKGFILRGTGTGTYAPGIKTGYYCMVQNNTSGSVTFRIFNVSTGASLTQIATSAGIYLDGGTTAMTVNKAYWFRASVVGNVIKMEYSLDGTTFITGISYTDASNLYPLAGSTQTVCGIGGSYTAHYIDDVVYKAASLGTQSISLDDKNITVFKKDNTISINSTEMTIKSVQLFDVNGRVIATKNNVNTLETSFSSSAFAKGLILVQITGTNNKIVTRRLLN